jgi:hypothetical protein
MNVYYYIQPTVGGTNGTCWVSVDAGGTIAGARNIGGYLVPAADTAITPAMVTAYGSWITEGPLDYTSVIQPFAFPFIGSMGQWDGTFFYMNLGWSGVPYNTQCLALLWAQTP